MAKCLHSRGITTATARLQDPIHPDYVAPAPWEEPLAHVSLTTSTPKHRLTPAEIGLIRTKVADIERREGTVCYFTDGSVDPNTGNAA